MTLIEKLDLLYLTEDERTKAIDKFLVTLSLISEDELREVLGYLTTQNVVISKAREIKVLSNSKDEISKKFGILGEIHETDLYRQDPLLLNKNVIDIYKKIKYCLQTNRAYKKEDGSYESFLFSENAWQQEISSENSLTEAKKDTLEEDLVTLAPFNEETVPVIAGIDDVNSFIDDKEEVTEEPKLEEDAKTTNFADIRKELEDQLKELDALKNDEVVGFDDIEPETYGMGRVA